ncbi:MAG: hypothetical protein QW594_01500 [Candidatus Woesearchaeota archaeon]
MLFLLRSQHQESDWSECLQCIRGTCPIRGPTQLQNNVRIARRKERVLAQASTMLAAAAFFLLFYCLFLFPSVFTPFLYFVCFFSCVQTLMSQKTI